MCKYDLKASQEIISNWNQTNYELKLQKSGQKSDWTLILNIQNIFKNQMDGWLLGQGLTAF